MARTKGRDARYSPATALGLAGLCLAVNALSGSGVRAQDDGVAGSGMHDGSGAITHHAAVELSMESLPGTGAARIAELGRAIAARMTAIRACYDGVAAARPTVEGAMRVTVQLAEGRGAPSVTVTEDGPNDAELTACIRTALTAMSPDGVTRPAGGVVLLTFRNTAAAGVAGAAAHAAGGGDVAVSRASGRPEATGEAREGALRMTVRGEAELADDLVREAYRVVASAIPGMLDCRRRASRRGRSPAGDITLSLALSAGAAAAVELGASTVADSAAGACVEEKLERAPHVSTLGPATVEVVVTFGS